jgi:YbbR domain-containing protein
MATATRPRSELLRALTDNLGLKGLALFLSVVLFAVVHSDVDAQRSVYVDVVALLPPPDAGRMLISEVPAQVRVTLRGSRSKLSELSRDSLGPLQIDLRDGRTGYHQIEATQLGLSSGVRVSEVTPSMLTLSWADAAEKRVSVQPELRGTLDKGYRLGTVETTPAFVTLRGPEQVLAQITTVSTDEVSLLGLRTGKQARRVDLQPLPRFVTYVEGNSVEVAVGVEAVVAERRLRRLTVAVVGQGSPLSLRPDEVTVRIRGAEEALEDVDPRAVVPFVDLAETQASGTHPLPVQVRGLPDGIEVAEIVPESILVSPKGKP